MLQFLSEFFQQNRIVLFAPIRLSDCSLKKPYLLEREGITDGTVILFAVPYFTADALNFERNLSAYAISKDYHGFFSMLYGKLLSKLREKFPQKKFAAFSDHSPIDEIGAALRCGLGILGDNHLLITKRYSSYVFLGEIVTDALLATDLHEIRYCEHCGACRSVCPMEKIGTCLSALTQKKGILTPEEEAAIVKYGSVWGCDLCQEICPHTKTAIRNKTIFSEIPYFSASSTPHLTFESVNSMNDEDFLARAYAWRGKETILRNLRLIEEREEKSK